MIFGWILLLRVWHAVQGAKCYANALGFQTQTSSIAAPAQIFLDAVGKKFTIFMMLIVIGAQFFCGMSSVTANSRMIYAFSRDGAIPGSKFWHRINKRTRTPTNSIWFAAVGAWIVVAPAYWLGSVTAYFAATAIAVIGLYIAYVIPTYLRLRAGDAFKPGPWNLGKVEQAGRDHRGGVGAVHLHHPDDAAVLTRRDGLKVIETLNYAPIAVAVVIGYAGIYWLVSARKWFHGPKVQGTPEELAAIEKDLERV